MSDHSPLTCKQLFDFLADYVEGSLDPAQRGEFERHIRGCRSCEAYLDGYRKTIALGKAACCGDEPAGSAEPPRAPAGILDAVRAAIRKPHA